MAKFMHLLHPSKTYGAGVWDYSTDAEYLWRSPRADERRGKKKPGGGGGATPRRETKKSQKHHGDSKESIKTEIEAEEQAQH